VAAHVSPLGVVIDALELDGTVRTVATVEGTSVHGVAASDEGFAVLVSSPREDLHLVAVDRTGTERFRTEILPGRPFDASIPADTEWFGRPLQEGRLDWDGRAWVAYHTVQRVWFDGIAHHGDQLTRYDASGARVEHLWRWGCSHSMEMRVTHTDTGRVVSVCSSDCYPERGVVYMGGTVLFQAPSGNCSGYVEHALGGLAWLPADVAVMGFTSGDGRGSKDPALAYVTGGVPGEVLWLSDAPDDVGPMRLARLGTGALVGWSEGGRNILLRLGNDGRPTTDRTELGGAALDAATDFVTLSNGSVAWLASDGLHQVRACEE
jgi:hypothetical protein